MDVLLRRAASDTSTLKVSSSVLDHMSIIVF
jgi:hypothetical protein